MLPQASLCSIINEEISLEGLEGSTLSSLWHRIAVRLEMAVPLPEKIMATVWAKVLRCDDFEFYLLLAARKPYVAFDRLAHVDPETGIPVQPAEYPGHRFKYNPIEANGVRGSCEEYETRTPIPREELLKISVQEAEEKYGLKLAIVASQRMRESFLIHANCTIELTIMQYCMLEWIARSRFNGETSHGKYSLLDVCVDSSSLFYNRKTMCYAKLITRQSLSIRSDDVSIQGMVMHLPRYYTEMKSKQLLIAERVVSELKRREHYVADYEEIKMMTLGRADAGKLFRTPEFQRYIKTDEMVPYRKIYPNAPVSSWQSKRGEEKLLRIMRLIDPNADVQDREGTEEVDTKDGFLPSASSSVQYVDMSIARQAYKLVADSGHSGISQSELAVVLELNRLHARSVLKNLIKLKTIESQSVDQGRQRMAKFFVPGHMQSSTGYDKELDQFRSNQQEVIESQRQQQSSVEAEELFQSSLVDLEPDTDAQVTDTYQTMFSGSASEGTAGATTNEDGDIVLPLNAFNNAAQDSIVTSVILSNKMSLVKVKGGVSDTTKSKSSRSMLVLRRCNFIVNLVKQEHALEPRVILKRLNSDERLNGCKHEACSKSILRLIGQLASDRLVVIANVTLKRPDDKECSQVYVCDPKIMHDLAPLQSKVNMAKVRVALQTKPFGATANIRNRPLRATAALRENSRCLPKCLRMKLLHEFLFYLVYEHRSDARQLPVGQLRKVVLEDVEAGELSPIYSDTDNWKMFVPPIGSKYESYGDGWVLLADVIVRMPLVIFCSIGAFAFYAPELDYYLDHPIRRYFLIKQLPDAIQEQLFAKRRYIYAILTTIKLLCYCGLLQMGPLLAKVLDQTLVYVNRNTALLDTTSSSAGYNEIEDRSDYPVLPFRLAALTDVKAYWRKLYEVATATRINSRSTAIGREILVQNLSAKPAMVDAVRERSAEAARTADRSQLPPGDRKGAAGMDTAMFMHLKSNWQKFVSFSMPIDRHRLKKMRKHGIGTGAGKKPVARTTGARGGLAASTAAAVADGKKLTLKKVVRSGPGATLGSAGISIVSKVTPNGSMKRLIKRRLIHPPKTVMRPAWIEGYDEVDRKALKLMNKLRVAWSTKEDQLLLVCRVALLYLYGSSKNTCCPIHSVIYRDIMHWSFADSQNKTSRSCQRRLTYMVTKISGYGDQVRTMLEECKLDAEISARYGPDFVRKLRERFPAQEAYVIAIRIHFVQLVHILRGRFARKLRSGGAPLRAHASGSAAGSSQGREVVAMRKLPNTLAEFYRQYNVTDPSVIRARLNYATDPTTEEELARYKVSVLLHSAVVNRRSVCEDQLQHILDRQPESVVQAAAGLLRTFQIVSVNSKAISGKMIITSASVAGERRIFHLSISYQQQLQTSIPLETFVPLFEQLCALVGSERYAEEPYECEDGGDRMALLLCELVAIGKVELGIDLASNYIEMRPDAVQGHSEMLQQLRGQGLTELLPGADAVVEETASDQATPPAKKTRKDHSQAGGTEGTTGQQRGKGTFVEPRKASPANRKRSGGRGRGGGTTTTTAAAAVAAAAATSSASRSKGVHFAADQLVTFQYAMHPIERLSKLPIEYFHFFCLLEQLRLADRRLLAQTFKIDEQQPSSCFLANCVVVCGSSGDPDLVGRCLALVRDRRAQLGRIRDQGGADRRGDPRKTRHDAAQFFDVREDNLLLFFGKYIDQFQQHAALKHKRDINRAQQQQCSSELPGLTRTPVNMAQLIEDCLAIEDEQPGPLQDDWLRRYEKTDATGDEKTVAATADTPVDDEDEEPTEGDGEEGRKTNDLLSALSEKVFKLHNFYEVTSKRIHVQVRALGGGGDGDGASHQEVREPYGRWQIPRSFLPSGAKRRKEILCRVASDAVWLQSDQMAPLMIEAMALIGRSPRARQLLEFIERKQKLGATVGELAGAFPNHGLLEQHLRTLQSFKCVLRTGFRSVTYVHWRYVDAWLTKTPHATDATADAESDDDEEESADEQQVLAEKLAGRSGRKRRTSAEAQQQEKPAAKRSKVDDATAARQEEATGNEDAGETDDVQCIQVAMAPWIKIDGTLNKRLLYRWLSAVLLYCVAHPGVPFSVLFTRFNMVSPFHLRQLAEILQDYGCVSLHSLECKPQTTLFSVYKPAKIVPVTELVPDEQTYIETPPHALSTLSLCIGQSRKYAHELYDPVRRLKRAPGTTEEPDSSRAGEGKPRTNS